MDLRPALRLAPLAFCTALLCAALYLALVCRAVPLEHVAFVILTSSYAALANYYVRRSLDFLPIASLSPRSLTPMRNSVRLLFPFTFVFSLGVPTMLLISAGSSPTDGTQTRLYPILAPHLFLMICQILVETVGSIFSTLFTLYVRFGSTVAFVVYRIPVALEWYRQAGRYARSEDAALLPPTILPLMQAAAILNIVYWLFALLCFLLLYCLPSIIRHPQTVLTSVKNERPSPVATSQDQ